MIVCYTSDAFTDNVVFMANVRLQKATSSEYNASVVCMDKVSHLTAFCA